MSLSDKTTIELIRQAREGDVGALHSVLSRCRDEVFRFAHGRLPRHARRHQDTEDLLHDVLLGVVARFEDIRCKDEEELVDYICIGMLNRIRNEIRNHRKKIQKTLGDSRVSPDPSALDHVVWGELFERYDTALGDLSQADRVALVAHYEYGKTFPQVAEVLKTSPDAVRMRVRRAVRRLRATLNEPLG